MTVGERMKMLRKKREISADTVAEALGVSRSTVFRYERGDIDKVPADLLERIASVLHTNSGYLLGWSEYDGPDIPSRGEVDSELTPAEFDLINSFRRLNDEGREKLLSYADDLVESGKYRPVVKKENAV